MARPTSWNDLSMNWSGTMTGIPIAYEYFDALTLALEERYPSSNLPAQEQHALPLWGATTSASWMQNFQDKITTIIPQYCNHNDEGNWDDDATGPAKWSEASLMTYLSTSRIILGLHSPITAAWMKQQYTILNQLRWFYQVEPALAWGNDSTRIPTTVGETNNVTSSLGTIAAAKTDADSLYGTTTYDPIGETPKRISWVWQDPGEDPSDFNAGYYNTKNSIQMAVRREFECEVDYYLLPSGPSSASGFSVGNYEDDSFSDFNLDVYNLTGTTTSTKDLTPGAYGYAWSSVIGNSTKPPSWPTTDPVNPNDGESRGWSFYTGNVGVVKYDTSATDGFQFID